MMKIVAVLSLIIGGLICIILGLLFPNKKIMNMNHKDKCTLEKHLKLQKHLDIIIAFWYVAVGILLFFDIITTQNAGLLVFPIFLIARIAEARISKKYQELN